MSDYISRQAAIAALNGEIRLVKQKDIDAVVEYLEERIRRLRDMPSADVVEVVRCKDCEHLEVLNEEEYFARCTQSGRLFKSFGSVDVRIHSCGRGERRTDES